MSPRPTVAALTGVVATLVLAACSSGGHSTSSTSTSAHPTTTAAGAVGVADPGPDAWPLTDLTVDPTKRNRPALVVNITSDAAVNAYAGWGAYGASKAALLHLSRIWDEELREHGVRVIAVDPGDMDTPLHALALPDADPAALKRPDDAAREIVDLIATHVAAAEVNA